MLPTIDQIKAMKTVTCPDCKQVLDSTDIDGLIRHIKERHPAAAVQIAVQEAVNVAKAGGLMR